MLVYGTNPFNMAILLLGTSYFGGSLLLSTGITDDQLRLLALLGLTVYICMKRFKKMKTGNTTDRAKLGSFRKNHISSPKVVASEDCGTFGYLNNNHEKLSDYRLVKASGFNISISVEYPSTWR